MRIQFNKPKQADLSSLRLDKSLEEIEEEEYEAFLTKPLKPESIIIPEEPEDSEPSGMKLVDYGGMKMQELREIYKSKWGTGRLIGLSKIDLITKIMDLDGKE